MNLPRCEAMNLPRCRALATLEAIRTGNTTTTTTDTILILPPVHLHTRTQRQQASLPPPTLPRPSPLPAHIPQARSRVFMYPILTIITTTSTVVPGTNRPLGLPLPSLVSAAGTRARWRCHLPRQRRRLLHCPRRILVKAPDPAPKRPRKRVLLALPTRSSPTASGPWPCVCLKRKFKTTFPSPFFGGKRTNPPRRLGRTSSYAPAHGTLPSSLSWRKLCCKGKSPLCPCWWPSGQGGRAGRRRQARWPPRPRKCWSGICKTRRFRC